MHANDLEAGGAGTHARHQRLGVHRRLAVDERERHELGEAAGVLLDRAQQRQVAHPVSGRLDVPVHDGRRRADAQRVRAGDDLQPLVDGDPPARDAIADGLVEDLRRRAGQGAEAGVLQLDQIVLDGHPRPHGAIEDFLG